MRLALTDLYRARWTERIHDEWTRNVLRQRPNHKAEDLQRTRALMNQHVRDSLLTGYEHLEASIEPPDPDDRHVAAAAIQGGAHLIVTFNLKDFSAQQPSSSSAMGWWPSTRTTSSSTFSICSRPSVCAGARRSAGQSARRWS